ncbi:hypothetical protein GQ53DRAFT_131315 [Thozetella sp. PMI_491]|nr:hypothetical protein GQ53DRAFT_131315 [Thozetella sp. PMI_491]
MRPSTALVPLAAGLAAAADSITVVVSDGVTATYTLPAWPSDDATSTVSAKASVTVTVAGMTTTGLTVSPTTLTVVPSAIPSGSTWGPPYPFGRSSSVGTASPSSGMPSFHSPGSSGAWTPWTSLLTALRNRTRYCDDGCRERHGTHDGAYCRGRAPHLGGRVRRRPPGLLHHGSRPLLSIPSTGSSADSVEGTPLDAR